MTACHSSDSSSEINRPSLTPLIATVCIAPLPNSRSNFNHSYTILDRQKALPQGHNSSLGLQLYHAHDAQQHEQRQQRESGGGDHAGGLDAALQPLAEGVHGV